MNRIWVKGQISSSINFCVCWHDLCGIFLGSKITTDGDYSHEIKRRLLLGRKVMTNLDSRLKSRDITLSTKVCLVKAMVFLVVMYGCESWTVKKAERRRTDAFELCLGLQGHPTSPFWRLSFYFHDHSFEAQKFSILIKSNLSIFSFVACDLVSYITLPSPE